MDDILKQINQARKQRFILSPQISLGDLISKLEAISDTSKHVYYDFGNFHPEGLNSYRGSYDEFAIGYTEGGKAPTLKDFLSELKPCLDATFEGYKGGEFVMGKETPVWCANYGNSTITAIVNILEADLFVYLITQYQEF